MTDTTVVTPNLVFPALDARTPRWKGQHHPRAGEYEWTDERVATLKQMWADGEPMSAIMKALGLNSRGAVSGKISRLKLPAPKTKQTSATYLNRPKHARRRPDQRIDMPVGKITFEDLTHDVCHFPVGDALPYLFCGEPTDIAPYCARCSAIATAPLRI